MQSSLRWQRPGFMAVNSEDIFSMKEADVERNDILCLVGTQPNDKPTEHQLLLCLLRHY